MRNKTLLHSWKLKKKPKNSNNQKQNFLHINKSWEAHCAEKQQKLQNMRSRLKKKNFLKYLQGFVLLQFLVSVLVCYKNSQHFAAAQVLGFREREKKPPIPCSEELPLWVQSRGKAGGLWLECLTAGSSYDTGRNQSRNSGK